jgi:CDP-paratose 2-epimerase
MALNHVITGGAGFIGTNLADHLLARGDRVTLLDDFSRVGSRENARWLTGRYPERLRVVEFDLSTGEDPLHPVVADADSVFHLAAQVAVTTSVTDPRRDFEVNALGTFNLLEAIRRSGSRAALLYSSTNKVYGEMLHQPVIEDERRYAYADLPHGVSEAAPLDFHSPYGCSKGAADQYVIDYSRIYGLRTVVFRQSCIYGPHQFGMEDQGWVAWFAIRALQGLPVVIYGDGKQVRDVLFIEDLVAAYTGAIDAIDRTAGQAYNLGGGPTRTLSLLELVSFLDGYFGRPLQHSFADWRPGDQRVYVSDVRKAQRDFGWSPRVDVEAGLGRLVEWLSRHKHVFDTPVREIPAVDVISGD